MSSKEEKDESSNNTSALITIQEYLSEEIGASFLDPDLTVSERLEKARECWSYFRDC